MPQAMADFALQNSKQLGTAVPNLIATAPQLILAPLNYTLINLKPFDIQVCVSFFTSKIYFDRHLRQRDRS
jgi:hypothetical protein